MRSAVYEQEEWGRTRRTRGGWRGVLHGVAADPGFWGKLVYLAIGGACALGGSCVNGFYAQKTESALVKQEIGRMKSDFEQLRSDMRREIGDLKTMVEILIEKGLQ